MAIANRPARSARRVRARAGLSLFEVLVAIGILVALVAVSLPWAWSRLAARDLPESAESITAILMLARAEAMATGRLVEVRVRRGETEASLADPSIEVRSTYLDLDRLAIEDAFEPELDEAFAFAESDRQGDGASRTIGASWSLRRLPAGIGLRPVEAGSRREFDPPEFDAAAEFAGTELIEALEGEPEAVGPGPIDRAIAIFLPDGSNMLAGAWWLEEVPADGVLPDRENDDRRRMRLSLGDPSGVPRWGEIERIVPRQIERSIPTQAESPREATPPRTAERAAERQDTRRETPRASRQAPASRASSSDPASRGDDERSRELDPDDSDEAER